MPQQFVKSSSNSWFQRIKFAIIGIPIGILLFLISVPVLWWNEGRAVQTERSLNEGKGMVVSLSDLAPDATNEGKLVHLTGEATTNEEIEDPVFGIRDTAIRLTRNVEMYQWVEEEETRRKKKVGGSEEEVTEYTYDTMWRADRVNSENFEFPSGHENPPRLPYSSDSQYAKVVTIGSFRLNAGQIERISNEASVPMTPERVASLSPSIKSKVTLRNNQLYIPASGVSATPNEAEPTAEADPSDIQVPETTGSPEVGDVRITFVAVYPTEISLIAKQVKETFEGYPTEAGDTLDMLQQGTHSAEKMFSDAEAANRMTTWILRAVGFVLMMVGVGLILGPLSVMADFIPVLGNVTRSITGIIAFAVAAPISLITIGLAWLFYRPVLGILLLSAAGAIVVGVVFLIRSRKQPPEVLPTPHDDIIDVG